MTTLLTFIGRTEANRAYRLATYRLDDGSTTESSLFAAAMLAHMKKSGRLPKRLVAIGTRTSGWDVLLELVSRVAPEAQDEALEWAIPVSESLGRGAVDDAHLRDFERRFSPRLGIDIRLCVAENTGESVFAAIVGALEPRSAVTLDITHSFRSMPVHALVALGALRWLKGIEIADILYGSLDEKSPDGTCAARSLGDTARLAHATPALAQLALEGDVGGIADIFEPTDRTLAERLRETQRLESLMQYPKASVPRGQALGTLRRLAGESRSSVERLCAETTAAGCESLAQGVGAEGLKNRAVAALDRGDLMRALGLANEALVVRVIELRGLRAKAKQEYDDAPAQDRDFYRILNRLARSELKSLSQAAGAPRASKPDARSAKDLLGALKDVRNAVMHAGGESTGQEVPDDIQSADKLVALIRWSLNFYAFLR